MTTASFDEMHNADTRRTPRGTPKRGRRCPPPPSRSSACVCVPACAIPPQKRDAIMKRKTKREFCQSLVQNERQLNKKTPRRAYSYYKSYSIVLMCNSLQQHARTCANRPHRCSNSTTAFCPWRRFFCYSYSLSYSPSFSRSYSGSRNESSMTEDAKDVSRSCCPNASNTRGPRVLPRVRFEVKLFLLVCSPNKGFRSPDSAL